MNIENIEYSIRNSLNRTVGERVREFVRNTFDFEYANATHALQRIARSGGTMLLTIEDEDTPRRNMHIRLDPKKFTSIDSIGYMVTWSSFYTITMVSPEHEVLASIHYPRQGVAEEINDNLYF